MRKNEPIYGTKRKEKSIFVGKFCKNLVRINFRPHPLMNLILVFLNTTKIIGKISGFEDG